MTQERNYWLGLTHVCHCLNRWQTSWTGQWNTVKQRYDSWKPTATIKQSNVGLSSTAMPCLRGPSMALAK